MAHTRPSRRYRQPRFSTWSRVSPFEPAWPSVFLCAKHTTTNDIVISDTVDTTYVERRRVSDRPLKGGLRVAEHARAAQDRRDEPERHYPRPEPSENQEHDLHREPTGKPRWRRGGELNVFLGTIHNRQPPGILHPGAAAVARGGIEISRRAYPGAAMGCENPDTRRRKSGGDEAKRLHGLREPEHPAP